MNNNMKKLINKMKSLYGDIFKYPCPEIGCEQCYFTDINSKYSGCNACKIVIFGDLMNELFDILDKEN